ncbi:MAG: TRAP transporter substrate-binding protein [Alphaproteobacteria bacterium]
MKRTLLTAVVAAALAAPLPSVAKELNLQSVFPAGLPVTQDTMDYFTKRIADATNGNLRFKQHEAGKLSPPFEVLENVGNGSIDAGWSYPAYWAGKFPVVNLMTGIPFGPGATEYITWILRGGGLELWQEAYDKVGVKVMPCGTYVAEAGGWFRKEIKTVEDYKGLKFRMPGLGGKVIAKLGASPQLIPVGEVYLALETGRLDGTEMGFPVLDTRFGFDKVAKNYYFPGWHNPATFIELLVNKKVWDGLTAGERSLIETTCQSANLFSIMLGSTAQHDALAKFRASGVKVQRFPPAVLAALKKATDEVMAEEAKKDPLFARGVESLKKFRAIYAEYEALSDTK